jgi:hypothetical protein
MMNKHEKAFLEVVDVYRFCVNNLTGLCEDMVQEMKDAVLEGKMQVVVAKRITKDVEATALQCKKMIDDCETKLLRELGKDI